MVNRADIATPESLVAVKHNILWERRRLLYYEPRHIPS